MIEWLPKSRDKFFVTGMQYSTGWLIFGRFLYCILADCEMPDHKTNKRLCFVLASMVAAVNPAGHLTRRGSYIKK